MAISSKVTVVAELSCNHCGNLDYAHQLIDYAADAKADVIKLQRFSPDQMTDPDKILRGGMWNGKHMLSLYKAAETPKAWFPELFAHIRDRGLVPWSTVCHPDDVAYLETLDCPGYKIASADMLYTDLIQAACDTGKPVIISTGMADETELDRLSESLIAETSQLTYLHCVASYPSMIAHAQLWRMTWLKKYGQVGLSDHSPGYLVPVMAVALGAQMVEKHLMLPWPSGSLDEQFSLEPVEFREMVHQVRLATAAMSSVGGDPERHSRQFRRTLRADGRWLR